MAGRPITSSRVYPREVSQRSLTLAMLPSASNEWSITGALT